MRKNSENSKVIDGGRDTAADTRADSALHPTGTEEKREEKGAAERS